MCILNCQGSYLSDRPGLCPCIESKTTYIGDLLKDDISKNCLNATGWIHAQLRRLPGGNANVTFANDTIANFLFCDHDKNANFLVFVTSRKNVTCHAWEVSAFRYFVATQQRCFCQQVYRLYVVFLVYFWYICKLYVVFLVLVIFIFKGYGRTVLKQKIEEAFK